MKKSSMRKEGSKRRPPKNEGKRFGKKSKLRMDHY